MWWGGGVVEPDGVVSLESESGKKEVDGVSLYMGLPDDIPNHVWYRKHGDRKKHMSRQGENGHLMLDGIGGEGEDCTE